MVDKILVPFAETHRPEVPGLINRAGFILLIGLMVVVAFSDVLEALWK